MNFDFWNQPTIIDDLYDIGVEDFGLEWPSGTEAADPDDVAGRIGVFGNTLEDDLDGGGLVDDVDYRFPSDDGQGRLAVHDASELLDERALGRPNSVTSPIVNFSPRPTAFGRSLLSNAARPLSFPSSSQYSNIPSLRSCPDHTSRFTFHVFPL